MSILLIGHTVFNVVNLATFLIFQMKTLRTCNTVGCRRVSKTTFNCPYRIHLTDPLLVHEISSSTLLASIKCFIDETIFNSNFLTNRELDSFSISSSQAFSLSVKNIAIFLFIKIE